MKQFLIRALSAALCIVLLTSMIFADFDASLEVDTSVEGQIKVTVAQSEGLEREPTLVIPCDFEYAYVTFNGEKIESTLENGEIRFTVSAGGEYVIVQDEAPKQPEEPEAPGTPETPPAVEVPVQPQQPTQPGGSNTVQLQPGTITEQTSRLDVAVGSGELSFDKQAIDTIREAADGASVTVSAQWDQENTLELSVSAGTKELQSLGGQVEVSVPYTPRETEDASELKVWAFDDNGKAVPCETEYENGTLRFTSETCGTFLVGTFEFEDVPEQEWYYGSVVWAKVNNLFYGTSEENFSPTVPMNRAMLITVLWRQAGSPQAAKQSSFQDLTEDYYRQAVAWAEENGIIAGDGKGSFHPNNDLTREQMALILMNYSEVMGMQLQEGSSLEGFADAENVSSYAEEAMQWAVSLGLLQGSGGKLMPGDGAQRCQVASILIRYSKLN